MLFSLNPVSGRYRKNGLLALSPMLFMALTFVALSFVYDSFSKVPLLIVFIATTAYAICTLRGISFEERIKIFSKGAGKSNLMLMIWIFILAGAFATIAKKIGAIDATVNFCLNLLPSSFILPGLFLAACIVSMSIGTSVGTIVALVPIAVGLSSMSNLALPILVASCVGGAFFGDNLSFISDTTVVATRTQGVKMSDKFRTNFRIVFPAAVLTFILYLIMGISSAEIDIPSSVNYIKILPYAIVILLALFGLNVLLVLTAGIFVCIAVGFVTGNLTWITTFDALSSGVGTMSELIIISMMAGGLLALIRAGGGITWLLYHLTHRIHTTRGAELGIALLVSLTNFCTANNTISILSVGYIAKDISMRFGVDSRRSASLLDTFSCIVQGLIPYGAQLLMASGLAAISPTEIIVYAYYPIILLVVTLFDILIWNKYFGVSKK